MSDVTNEAVLKLYDHMTDALNLIGDLGRQFDYLEAEGRRLEARVDALAQAIVGINTIAAGRNEEIAELRDFVHGLNDRHTGLALELRAIKTEIEWPEGATAPVAGVSE